MSFLQISSRRPLSLAMLLLLTVALYAGGAREPMSEDGRIQVAVSILPQKYFVERIGGDAVNVSVLVPPGRDPHTYDPTPRQAAALGESRALFLIGENFEQVFVPRIRDTLPNLRIVHTYRNVRFRSYDDTEGHHHDDHHDDHHGHESDHNDHLTEHDADRHRHDDHQRDTHIWLGPNEVKTQAEAIRDALIELDPDRAGYYRANYQEFARDIDDLHLELSEVLRPVRGEIMLVYHAAFGYFADAYGLRQVAIETGGSEPTARQIERIIEEARHEGVRVIFVQPEFPVSSARAVAEATNAAVVQINPLAPDWLDNMHRIAAAVRAGLEQDP